MYRIIQEPDFVTITAARPDEITQVLQHAPPGRFILEEVSPAGQFLPSGHTCRRWGTAIRQHDGSIILDPDPWLA
jgi:hypothetical protein